jgi:hypothetical protein
MEHELEFIFVEDSSYANADLLVRVPCMFCMARVAA